MLPLVADETIKGLSKYSKEAIYLLSLLLISSLSYSSRFITYAPFFVFLGKLYLE